MRDVENDPISAAFADFRRQETPRMKLAGMAAVRAAVRRRRNVRVVAAAVLTAVVVAVPAVGYAYVSGRHAPAPVGASPGPIVSSSTHATAESSSVAPDSSSPSSLSPSGPSSTKTLPQCGAAQLTGSATGGGSMASQPFVIIALTNISGSPCQLTGYPGISATVYAQSTPSKVSSGATSTLPITVTDGAIYEYADPGPQRIELAPHGSASFALGTSTALDGGADMHWITNVGVIVPGDETGVPVTVSVGTLGASHFAGQPIPITVTAFVAGIAGPPHP